MKKFWNILRHKYFKFAAAIMIVFLPLVLILNQKQQELRGRAETSTTLSFSPPTTTSTPLSKKVGENFYLDLMLNPGNNLVSLAKLDILYDEAKVGLDPVNPIVVNDIVFPQIVEGPVYTPGRIQIVLSVGSDLSKAIATESRILTLNLVAKGNSRQTIVNFGPNNQVFSVAAIDLSDENVLSFTTPAYIKISNAVGKGGGKGKPPR